MQLMLILVAIAGVALVVYFIFLSPSKISFGKPRMPSLEEEQSDRLQRELSNLKSNLDKSETGLSTVQKELENERKTKQTFEDEIANMKAEFDKMRSECDLLKIENSSLKGKYMEKDRELKKHIEELKILREKVKEPLEKPKAQAGTPVAPIQNAPKESIKKDIPSPVPQKEASTPIQQGNIEDISAPEITKHDHTSIAKFMEESIKEIEKDIEPEKKIPDKPKNTDMTNLRLVEDEEEEEKKEEGNDDTTKKD